MQEWVDGLQREIDELILKRDRHIEEFTKAFKLKDDIPTMEART